MPNNQIALLARTPEFDTPAESEAKALQLQTLRDTATQRHQAGVDAAAQRQRDNADDIAVRGVYQNTADPTERIKALYGVSPKAAMVAEKFANDSDKERATTTASQVDTARKKIDAVGQALGFVMRNPSADSATRAVQTLVMHGMLTAEEGDHYHAEIAKNPDPEHIRSMAAESYAASLKSKDQLSKIETRDLGGTVQTTATDPITGVPTVTNTMVKTQTPDSVASNARIASEGRLNRQNQLDVQERKSNSAAPTMPGVASGTLDGTDAIVQAIIDGRKTLSAPEMKSAYGQNLMSLVAKKDPGFDLVNFGARAKTRNDFVAGKSAENIKAINTAIAHMGALDEQMTALGNGDSQLYNRAANWIGTRVGQDPALQEKVASVEATAEGVAGEMAKVFRSTGMSEHEIDAWRKKLEASTTPGSQRGTMRSAMHMLQGRMDAIGEQYKNGMGTSAQPLTMLTPEAQQIFDRLNGGKAGRRPTSKPIGGAQPAAANAKGWALHVDGKGNKAYVSPDGTQFEEVK